MDCEKFDSHLIDLLHDELDEVTEAAMTRHAGSCARCSELEAGARATLEIAILPLEEPSDDLEARILEAALQAHEGEPLTRRIMTAIAWAGSNVMRPQFAMAALLMLVLGSSVLLLRARPGAVATVPHKVTETAVPAPAENKAADAPAAAPAAPPAAQAKAKAAEPKPPKAAAAASAAPAALPSGALAQNNADDEDKALSGAEAFDRGMSNYRAGRFRQAERDFAQARAGGGSKAGSAALLEARAARAHSGCAGAVPHYQRVRSQHGGSASGADATWELADCYRLLGKKSQARELWMALKSDKQYGARAASELSGGKPGTSGGSGVAAKRRARSAPRPAPAPAKAAPPPQQTSADAF